MTSLSADPGPGTSPEEAPRAPRVFDACRDVQELVIGSWWNIDHEAGVGGEQLFTPGGVCQMPALTMSGRQEIGAGYARRQEAGARISRHLVTNLLVDVASDDEAVARYVVVLYAARGKFPATLTEPQALVDVVDDCVRTDEGWRIRHRRLATVFLSDANDSVMLETPS